MARVSPKRGVAFCGVFFVVDVVWVIVGEQLFRQES
jgi:hypothetical protein